jgi:leader peptidase (prepilin peptidase)/N-methyltransferase
MTYDDNLAFWLSWPVLAVLGLLVGSFLNVVIHRTPIIMFRDWWSEMGTHLGDEDEWARVFGGARPDAVAASATAVETSLEALPQLGIAKPASRCPHCSHRIRWYENVPVVSWLALRGKCSACGARISMRYPVVELATGALFGLAAWRFGPHVSTLAWCAALALLVALAMIDFDTQYLPDSMNGPLLWGGLLAAVAGWTIPLQTAVIGAAAGYLALWSLYWLFKLTTGREGMGAGDFKLLAALCAWLGWQALLPITLMASVVGIVVTVPRRLFGKFGAWQQTPFGPYLAGGGIVVILVGVDRCLSWLGIQAG